MSGLSKPRVIPTVDINSTGILVDPTVELTQPGGPAQVGHAILADGLGGYSIAPTLRPYLLGFKIPSLVLPTEEVFCEYQGVSTSVAGAVLPFTTNLIAISVAVDLPTAQLATYRIEVISNPTGVPIVLSSLVLSSEKRINFRRDLSVAIEAGSELGVKIVQTSGGNVSLFTTGIVSVELES